MSNRKLILPVVVLVFVLGVVAGAIGVYAQGSTGKIDPLPAGVPYAPNEAETSLANVYQQVSSSVVNVSVAESAGGMATGSGFVIDTDGHIVTNNHVVEGGTYYEVTFRDGSVVEATLVGRDPDADLAVIKVDPTQVSLQPVAIGDSSKVFIGQQVMAIGSPFGQEQAFTLTTGIVSAIGRSLRNENRFSIPELIQTDAAINPGNSGGPLLDMAGNVIGINTAILSASNSGSGVGFAIPSNTVRRIVPYLIRDGGYKHTWLGIQGTTLLPPQREAMKISNDVHGVVVSDVTPGGPADQAGLQGSSQAIQTPLSDLPVGGDVITAINGQQINQMDDLISYLEENTLPGDQVTLTIWRNGQTQDVQVTLQQRPQQTLQ
jgi:S1-C subfamily serine protease